MSETSCPPVTAEELARCPIFADDDEAARQWLAPLLDTTCYAAGDRVIHEGEAITEMMVILDGELHFRRENDPLGALFIRTAGQATGLLPFSRMKVARGTGLAATALRTVRLHHRHFRELLYRAPCLAQKLVWEMMDRTRESTQMDERASRLLALGKLSAGLAHELNNPAAAAVRSAARLREALLERQRVAAGPALPAAAQAALDALSQQLALAGEPSLDPLARSDAEADLADWFAARGVEVEPALPDALAGVGLTPRELTPLAGLAAPGDLARGLATLAADQELLSLTREVEEAARRISDLVQAVKTYSYMDQAPLSEVDLEPGLVATLKMFQHQIKHGVRLRKELAGGLPRIPGNGSALNQVWTNLIDNALDATEGQPERELLVRTCSGGRDEVLVEIGDNGPGIPAEVRNRIFDPFFTTKPVGEGTGLGLDIVQRIIRQHRGSITVQSAPGRTLFQVRLPLKPA